MIELTPTHLGASLPKMAIYLNTHMPNCPDVALGHHQFIEELIALNGNHWRKILVISAKLAAPDDNWRGFLEQQLLQQVQFCTAPHKVNADYQLIAGKANWPRFGHQIDLKLPDFCCIGEDYLVPYPDYRQFPNWLIAVIRDKLYG